MLALAEVKERLATMGFSPIPGTPQEFAAHIKEESDEWGRVVRQAKIQID
jgi:tripartite-type tricarboxylate transporter receptor subunit TctC